MVVPLKKKDIRKITKVKSATAVKVEKKGKPLSQKKEITKKLPPAVVLPTIDNLILKDKSTFLLSSSKKLAADKEVVFFPMKLIIFYIFIIYYKIPLWKQYLGKVLGPCLQLFLQTCQVFLNK